jgi:hypothetical protein
MKSLLTLTCVLVAVVVVLPAALAGQTQGAKLGSGKTWTAPKMPWGDPDLQGVWTSDDMLSIPMQRPEQFAGRAELTDEEFAERQKRDQQSLERNRNAVGAFGRRRDADVPADFDRCRTRRRPDPAGHARSAAPPFGPPGCSQQRAFILGGSQPL